jgi:2-C-methyl-D-erythritol 4-phosphate cytidylyltransferase
MVAWAVSALIDAGCVEQIVVVTDVDMAVPLVRQALSGHRPDQRAVVIGGGPSRHASLHRALSTIESHVEIVVLHDACRPLAPPEVVSRVVGAVRRGAPGAVPVVEVTETVKELDPDGRVTRTVPRESVVRLQRPQAVRRSLLDAAHARCAPTDLTTDEAGALAPPGTSLVTVQGDHDAFPVLRPADLTLAQAVLARRSGQ